MRLIKMLKLKIVNYLCSGLFKPQLPCAKLLVSPREPETSSFSEQRQDLES